MLYILYIFIDYFYNFILSAPLIFQPNMKFLQNWRIQIRN